MKWSKIIITALIGFVIIFTLKSIFWDREVTIKNYPPATGSIVAFGDSLVEGVGSPSTEGFILPLSEMLGEKIINMGVSGDTTVDGLNRLDKLIAEKPRVVLILLGGNDYIRKISSEKTFNNLRTIINTVQESGAVVVLLGVRGGLLSDSYEKSFEKLAEETGSAYVPDVLDGLFGRPALMSDAIHPNTEGYQRIAEKVYPILNKVAF